MPKLVGHPYRFSPGPPPRSAVRRPPPEAPRPRRPLLRRKRVLIPAGLLLVALGLLAVTASIARRAEEQARLVSAERARFAEFLETRAAPFRRVPLLSARERAQLRRSINAVHLAHGLRLGVEPVAGREGLEALLERRGLERLEAGPYYWVARLTHSVPYLTPDALAALDSIGVRFNRGLAEAGLPPYRFNVSSVLRTGEDQARLRRVNVNAARGTSSHELGTTFDLHAKRYRYGGGALMEVEAALGPPPFDFLADEFARELAAFYERAATDYVSRLEALLGRALIDLEDEGVLVTILERRQPVFHTTVARRLAREP